MTDRIVSSKRTTEEAGLDVGLRPQSLDEYIGQDRVKENLPTRPWQDDLGPRVSQ
jgi:Holliday junction DNA helicase RuvB